MADSEEFWIIIDSDASSSEQESDCIVSAPGKVLLAGGYLVLDRKHTGLVFGLDARIHVRAQQQADREYDVTVRSPQFKTAEWRYKCDRVKMEMTEVDGKKNDFVEVAVSYAIAYAATYAHDGLIGPPMVLTILADDGYYSRSEAPTNSNSRFSNFGVAIEEVNKTGLGSSAALVTAVVAAIVIHRAPIFKEALSGSIQERRDDARRKLHNLAQVVHCAAQGKIGSGFDIASAVYGSCKYRRFEPELLEKFGEPDSGRRLRVLVDEKLHSDSHYIWNYEIDDSVTIPRGLRLVMCDVDCGSKTPGMVRDVLKWRRNNQEAADALWAAIQEQNDALRDGFIRLDLRVRHLPNEYFAGPNLLVHHVSIENFARPNFGISDMPIVDDTKGYRRLHETILQMRKLTREMSRQAGVPIEPEEQTRLIDACSELKGVIGGVVPGAGGYDAVAFLVEDREDVVMRLGEFLEGWDFSTEESRARGSKGKVRLLGVRGEREGLRVESVDSEQYGTWFD